eukprot:3908096-Prymnesium_polylepis.1
MVGAATRETAVARPPPASQSLIFTGSATLANPASSTPRPARPWQPEGDPDKPHEPPSPVRL